MPSPPAGQEDQVKELGGIRPADRSFVEERAL